MTQTLKVEIDINQVLALAHELTPAAMQNAWRRTLPEDGKLGQGPDGESRPARKTKIHQKLLRQRLYFSLRSRDTGKVWLGLNAIEAHRLETRGRPDMALPLGATDSRGHG